MTASGFRSSWLTSASRLRRCASSVSSRATIVSNPSASARCRRRPVGIVADADRVVAGLDPVGGLDQAVERPSRAPEQSARSPRAVSDDRRRSRRTPGNRPRWDRMYATAGDERPGDEEEERARTGSRSRASVPTVRARVPTARARPSQPHEFGRPAPSPRPRVSAPRSSPGQSLPGCSSSGTQSADRSSANR